MKMNKLIIGLIVFLYAGLLQAQERYSSQITDSVKTETFTYAEKSGQKLELDIYRPALDNTEKRPVFLFVHGGGFSAGTRNGEGTVRFSKNMAKLGYVAVSISYRLLRKETKTGFGCDCPVEDKMAAIGAAVNDLTDAVRFLNNKKEEFKIDPDKIILCGSSTGAETVLSAVYNPRLYGIESNPVKYAGVISMAGAIVDTSQITSDLAVPSLFFHGTTDDLVPYETAPHHYSPEESDGFFILHGSKSIAKKLELLGEPFWLYTVQNKDHSVSWTPMHENVDEVIRFCYDFVLNRSKEQTYTVIPDEKRQDATSQKSQTKQNWINYLNSIKNKQCISGQFIRWNYNASLKEITAIHDSSGQWVGLLGADYYGNFQDSIPSPRCDYKLTNKVVKSYYKKNGIVNLSVHFINPQTMGSAWSKEIDFDSLFVDGSQIRKVFFEELDTVAVGLQDLCDAGIMVMFRPFHEMNGGWFWWGKKERFVELWRMTYDYIVNTKGLNNLLWCWSPDIGPGNIAAYYPGDKYVDVVGLDAYTPDLPTKAQRVYNEILKYNKPFGFTEYGCEAGGEFYKKIDFDYSIFLKWIDENFPETTFFLAWRDNKGMVGKPGVRKLLNDPVILNREGLNRRKVSSK